MGANHSRPGASIPVYHGPRSLDHPWPTRPHYPSRARSHSDAQSQSTTNTEPLPRAGPSQVDTASQSRGPSAAGGSTHLSRSASLFSRPSNTVSRVSDLDGGQRRYHHNPRGLAGLYDWEREEGGYIPYQHQEAHRKRWRREMRHALREEQQRRASKFTSVEEKKAERRRAWEEHLAARNHADEEESPYLDSGEEASTWELL